MENNKKEGVLLKTLDRTNFWINNVDAKTSFLLSLSGVILGFIFTSDSIEKGVSNSLKKVGTDIELYLSIVNILLILLTIFFIGSALINFFSALKGRIDATVYEQEGVETKSLLFWGTISKHSHYKEFKDKLSSVSEETLLNDLQSQVFINSLITTKKFEIYNNGLRNLTIGIILLIVFKLLSYIPL